MVIGGRNTGRIGTITHRERHASKSFFKSLQFSENFHHDVLWCTAGEMVKFEVKWVGGKFG